MFGIGNSSEEGHSYFRHKLRKGAFMQISQEESGAITLTIPKSTLDDTAEEQVDNDVSQLTTKVTLSEW